MQTPEHILDICLQRLRAGESVLNIANTFPEHRDELTGFLAVAESLINLPIKEVPTPIKRFKYAEQNSSILNLNSLRALMRFSVVPVALFCVVLGGKALITATSGSLPGDTLYTVKRATESARINLIQDEKELAIAHVELAQKRLEEAKQAISENDPETETAAIAALKEQTEKTLATAAPLAATIAAENQDNSLINELVAIHDSQKLLLASITKQVDSSITDTVMQIAQATEESVSQLLTQIQPQEETKNEAVKPSATNADPATTAITHTTEITEPQEDTTASIIAEPAEPQYAP